MAVGKLKPKLLQFRGNIDEFIYVSKKDLHSLGPVLEYINKIKNVDIKAKKWTDDGEVWILLKINKVFSKEEIEEYLKDGPKHNEDRICYAGSINNPLFEIHYSRLKKFVVIEKNKVRLLHSFDSVLKIIGKYKNLKEIKVIAIVSDNSDLAKKYKFDTGEN